MCVSKTEEENYLFQVSVSLPRYKPELASWKLLDKTPPFMNSENTFNKINKLKIKWYNSLKMIDYSISCGNILWSRKMKNKEEKKKILNISFSTSLPDRYIAFLFRKIFLSVLVNNNKQKLKMIKKKIIIVLSTSIIENSLFIVIWAAFELFQDSQHCF